MPAAIIILFFLMASVSSDAASESVPPEAPYPWSDLQIQFFPDSHYTPRPGCRAGQAPNCLGDNWPTTSSSDRTFTVWGDGVGPSGQGRNGSDVSLGIASLDAEGRMSDSPPIYLGARKDARCKAETIVDGRLCGKSYGILADGDDLWMWVSPGSGRYNYTRAELFHSEDQGGSWQRTDVVFDSSQMILPTFVQFDPDYQGDFSDYVYIFGIRAVSIDAGLVVQKPGEIVAFRVARKHLADRGRYESLGVIFRDENGGVGWTISARFDERIEKFVLMTEHGQTMQSRLGVFVSDSLNGEWQTAAYYDSWAKGIKLAPVGSRAFHWNIAGYTSTSDDRFRIVFSGIKDDDTYQTIDAKWRTRGE